MPVALDGADRFRGCGGEVGRFDGQIDQFVGRDADAQPVHDRARRARARIGCKATSSTFRTRSAPKTRP